MPSLERRKCEKNSYKKLQTTYLSTFNSYGTNALKKLSDSKSRVANAFLKYAKQVKKPKNMRFIFHASFSGTPS